MRLPRKATGRNTWTANRISLRPSCRWRQPSLRAAYTSPAGTMPFPNVQLSARRSRIPREATCKRSLPMARARQPGCWATCSGQPSVLPQEIFVPRRLTLAREEWAQARGPTISLSRCRHCDNNKRIGKGSESAVRFDMRPHIPSPVFRPACA
jgi:hypothetical protein